jgi:hypothetical protein
MASGNCEAMNVYAVAFLGFFGNLLVLLVNIALGNAPPSACVAGDLNRDAMIAINELIAAVNSALNDCRV